MTIQFGRLAEKLSRFRIALGSKREASGEDSQNSLWETAEWDGVSASWWSSGQRFKGWEG